MSLFSALGASSVAFSEPVWTIKKESTYVEHLISSGARLNTNKSFLLVLNHLASKEPGQVAAIQGDFFLIIRASPDSGEYRALLASRCGSETYCPTMTMHSLDRVETVAPKLPSIRFRCPTTSRYPLVQSTRETILTPGAASNYLVCRTNGVLHRFAIDGGVPLPTEDAGRLRAYLTATYPGLF